MFDLRLVGQRLARRVGVAAVGLASLLFPSVSEAADPRALPSIPPGLLAAIPQSIPSTLPPWTSLPGAQLPPGWTWPTLPSSGGGVPRPIDLGALLAQAASCPPVQIAPNVYVPMPCAAPSPSPHPAPRAPKYHATGPLPAFVDLPRAGLDGPIKDQAQVGMCWAFALSTAAEGSLRRQGYGDLVSATHILAARSEKRLYARGAQGTAIAPDASWPYDPVRACMLNDVLGYRDPWCERAYHVQSGTWRAQPQIVAELRNADAQGRYRIRREQLSGNIEEIAVLLAQGRAVMADIAIDSWAWGQGASSGTLPDYVNADRGGHAVVLVGYAWNGPERYFLVHNSWGTDWGKGGYVWIANRTLARHLETAAIADVYPVGAWVPEDDATGGV